VNVEFLSQSAEDPLPIANESIDTVIVMWILCSIPNTLQALKEMKRLLKWRFVQRLEWRPPRMESYIRVKVLTTVSTLPSTMLKEDEVAA
jgi:ubiquinone/menaquinone biosynthesis C-methylase UbiE